MRNMERWFMTFVFMFSIFLGMQTMSYAAAQWTFLVYLDADNNLEQYGIADFLEMAQVGSNADVNIIVQMDRIDGYATSYDNWTSTKRFRVTSGMTPIAANALQDIGEANMGDPTTLTSFINWGAANYPAQNYAIILWNHGGGWREEYEKLREAMTLAKTDADRETVKQKLSSLKRPTYKAVCWDDTNNGDALYMKEVKNALNAASVDMHLIGFDACLMGMVEVAYEVRDTGASVLVGSEELEPGNGWPYHTILGDLAANPSWPPTQLGTAIVDRYYASYGNDETQAAIDLTHLPTLATTISTFAQTMRTSWNTDQTAVKNAAQAVINEITATVIHEQHGSAWPGSHGLAIYFPASQWTFDSAYNSTNIDFPLNTVWEEFLSDFYASMGGSWIASARNASQEYDVSEHIDLYDFCDNLINPPPPPFSGCTNAITLVSGMAYNGTTVGGTSTVSSYNCSSWNESGPENVYTITTTAQGAIMATLSNLSVDLDVFILNACDPNSCARYGDNSATYADAPVGAYYIIVDGYYGASGTYTLAVTFPSTADNSYLLWSQ